MRAVKASERPQDAREGQSRQIVRLVLPGLPPTVNHMYVGTRGGGKALSAAALAYRKEVWAACGVGPRVPAEGALALTLRLTYGDRRRTDIDNRVKAALDALAAALGFDDSRVGRLVVERAGYVRGRPACELVLEVLE